MERQRLKNIYVRKRLKFSHSKKSTGYFSVAGVS